MPLNAPPATSLPSLRSPVVAGSTSANDLVSLRTQVRALLPSTLQTSEGGTNTPNSKEIDEMARRVVELHMERLHEWNEVRDAVQHLIDKYAMISGRSVSDVRADMGLEKGD